MSLSKETIQIIAQTQGISKLKDDIASQLASDVEYRIREVIQDASKFMKHSKRKKLTTEDINHALVLKNVEPLYGFQTAASTVSHYRKVQQQEDIYYLDDAEIELDSLLQAPLPKIPVGPTVASHWLAIQGVQPKIPQNPKIAEEVQSTTVSSTLQQSSESSTPQLVKPLVKHVLSAELQMYYEKVTEAIKGASTPAVLKASLHSLATDPGLNQLVPYFTQFVAEEVTHNLRDLPRLKNLMEMVKALLVNPNLQVELYLHQLMPSILTCLLGKTLCTNPRQDHWSLRRLCAELIGIINRQYSSSYHTLQSRITRTLLHTFLDPQKPRTSHYGAICGITALGPHISQLLLLEPKGHSNLKAYWQFYLEPLLLSSDSDAKYSTKRHEAWMLFGALLEGASSLFIRLRRFFVPLPGINTFTKNIEETEDYSTPTTPPVQQASMSDATPQETLSKELKDRMNLIHVPSDIHESYNELFEVFGEGLLPYISYEVYPSPSRMSAMDLFL